MDPITNQMSYADSDHIRRNYRSLLKKLAIVFLCAAVIGTLTGLFVWPIPQMRVAENIQMVEDQYNANNFDEALSILEGHLKEDPDNSTYLIKKSLILAQKGKQSLKEEEFGPKAASAAEAAIALYPNESEAYRALGYAYEIQEKYEEAHSAYDQALLLDPDNARALYGKGHTFELEGDMISAEERYRSALLKDPMFDEAYVGVGRALAQKGEGEEAVELLTKAFWLTHNIRLKAEALTVVASVALIEASMEEAIGAAEQAITIDPSYSNGWYIYGKVLYEDSLNEKKYRDTSTRNALILKSIQQLQQALRLNPNQAMVHHQLGIELGALKRPFEASEAFRKGLASVDNDITLTVTERILVKRKLEESLQAAVKQNGILQPPKSF